MCMKFSIILISLFVSTKKLFLWKNKNNIIPSSDETWITIHSVFIRCCRYGCEFLFDYSIQIFFFANKSFSRQKRREKGKSKWKILYVFVLPTLTWLEVTESVEIVTRFWEISFCFLCLDIILKVQSTN